MSAAEADPEWAAGFEDECWWSRVALPTLSSFSEEGKPLRLLQRSIPKDDPEPKAVSCYGLYLPEIVKADVSQPSALEQRLERAVAEVGGVDEGPGLPSA